MCVHACVHIPEVEVFELLQTADLSRQLFNLVVEHVQNLQVLQLRDVRRHSWGRHKIGEA